MLLSSRIFLSVNRAIVTPFTSSISSRRFPWVIWLVRGGKREVSLTPCRSSTFPPVLSSESPGRQGAFHGVELPWQSEFAVSSSPLPIQLKSAHQGGSRRASLSSRGRSGHTARLRNRCPPHEGFRTGGKACRSRSRGCRRDDAQHCRRPDPA